MNSSFSVSNPAANFGPLYDAGFYRPSEYEPCGLSKTLCQPFRFCYAQFTLPSPQTTDPTMDKVSAFFKKFIAFLGMILAFIPAVAGIAIAKDSLHNSIASDCSRDAHYSPEEVLTTFRFASPIITNPQNAEQRLTNELSRQGFQNYCSTISVTYEDADIAGQNQAALRIHYAFSARSRDWLGEYRAATRVCLNEPPQFTIQQQDVAPIAAILIGATPANNVSRQQMAALVGQCRSVDLFISTDSRHMKICFNE